MRSKKNLHFLKRILIVVTLFLCIFGTGTIAMRSNTTTVFADDGIEQSDKHGFVNKDSGIYKEGEPTRSENKPSHTMDWGEKLLRNILKTPGEFLLPLENDWGMTLDNVIYGRIVTPGTNFYSFELYKGNPYGLVAAKVYNIFRTICFVGVVMLCMGQVTKVTVFSSSAKAREGVKESLTKACFIIPMLFVMPYLLDLALYLRDIILYVFKYAFGGTTITVDGTEYGVSAGLSTTFAALSEESWIWALVFSASTFLALYFAYLYAALAMGMVVYFSIFPVSCVMSYTDKNVLNNWVKNVTAVILVPCIDAFLLNIPVDMYRIVSSQGYQILAGVLTLITCMCIMTTRKAVANTLGLNLGGIGAFAGAAVGAMALARSAGMLGKSLHDSVEHRRNAKSMQEEADMLDSLDGEDAAAQNLFNKDMSASLGSPYGDKDIEQNGDNDSMGGNNGEVFGDSAIGAGAGAAAILGGGGSGGGSKSGGADFGTQAKYANLGLEQENNQSQEEINNQKAALEAARGQLNSGAELSPDEKTQFQQDIMSAQSNIRQSEGAIATNRAQMTDNNMSAMERQAQLNAARQRVIDSAANINNMNNMAYSGMSNKRRAELLRQSAKRENRRAVASFAGAGFGAVTGASAGLFLGPMATAAMTAGGAALGNAAGHGIVDAGYAVNNTAHNFVNNSSAGRFAAAGFKAGVNTVVSGAVNSPQYGGGVRATVRTVEKGYDMAQHGTAFVRNSMDNAANGMNAYSKKLENSTRDAINSGI